VNLDEQMRWRRGVDHGARLPYPFGCVPRRIGRNASLERPRRPKILLATGRVWGP